MRCRGTMEAVDRLTDVVGRPIEVCFRGLDSFHKVCGQGRRKMCGNTPACGLLE